jgi:acyl carrier protein
MMTAVETRVMRILSRTAMLPAEDVTPEASLKALDIKSLEQIECVLALEDEFHIELPQSDMQTLRTVQDIIDAVQRVLAKR